MCCGMDAEEADRSETAWCIVANVAHERSYGPGGAETRRGTKHFAPGAKVYIVDFFWGMGAENVTVVGRHRKSHRYITLAIRSRWLVNWRVELVYSPYVVGEIIKHQAYKPDPAAPEKGVSSRWWTLLREGKRTAETIADKAAWFSCEGAKAKAENIIASMAKYHESVRTTQPFGSSPPHPEGK